MFDIGKNFGKTDTSLEFNSEHVRIILTCSKYVYLDWYCLHTSFSVK